MPGPIPQRTENLLGHSASAKQARVTRVQAIMPKVDRPKADDSWDPVVKRLYNAACYSGQARYFEPSDYAYLYFTCAEVNYYLDDNRSAMRLQVINQMLVQLLFTEGERRRVQMEIEREVPEDPLNAEAQEFYADLTD